MTDYTIKRGPYGKPWITRDGAPLDWPDGVDKPLNGHLYERISDLGGNLEDKSNLSPYHQAQAVLGTVTNRHLFMQFRALASEHQDPWNGAKREVKDLLYQARMAGGEEHKSGVGTGFHRYAHLVDEGVEIEYPVNELEPWLWCYGKAMERFTVLSDEGFVVVDDLDDPGGPEDLRVAGSFDRILLDNETGEVMVADIKTGKADNEYAMSPTIQTAGYAHGKLFSQETGLRAEIHPALSATKTLLVHVPINGGGAPECCIYPLDQERGWDLAVKAVDASKAKKMRAAKRDVLSRAKWSDHG